MRLVLALALAVPAASLSAQKPLAHWDFNRCNSSALYSRGHDKCSAGGRLSSWRKLNIMKENGSNNNCVLVLSPSQFPSGGVGSSTYDRNAIFLTVSPNRGVINLKELSFTIIRAKCSIVLGIDVFADEDAGRGGNNFKTRIGRITLPRETSATPKRRSVKVDLSNVSFLQTVSQTIRLRLNVYGKKGHGCSKTWSTCLDDITVGGDCKECPRASVKVLGHPHCEPRSWLTMSGRPAFGTVPKANISASKYPGGKVYLFVSIGCGTGTKLPGTGCELWMKGKPYLWKGATLNSHGHASFPLPILPAYSRYAGIEIGVQALLWTNQGDGLSNGLCLKLGCD